ncbi:TetR family transcriptional regulator [Nocardia terpenica]|uniref:hypothetical protein n=1 Tax=Nocardia terpenica TaxID=455432 RepID=UPI002FDFE9B3
MNLCTRCRDAHLAVLLAAARLEFGAHGYHHTGLEQIAARADMPTDAVEGLVGGKPTLLLAALADGLDHARPTTPPNLEDPPVEQEQFVARLLSLVGPHADLGLARLWRDCLGLVTSTPDWKPTTTGVFRITAGLLARVTPDTEHWLGQAGIADFVLAFALGATTAPAHHRGALDFTLAASTRHRQDSPASTPRVPRRVRLPRTSGWPPPPGSVDLCTGTPIALDESDPVVLLDAAGTRASTAAGLARLPLDEDLTLVVECPTPDTTLLARALLTAFTTALPPGPAALRVIACHHTSPAAHTTPGHGDH